MFTRPARSPNAQRQKRYRQRSGEAVFGVRVGHPVIEALPASQRLTEAQSLSTAISQPFIAMPLAEVRLPYSINSAARRCH